MLFPLLPWNLTQTKEAGILWSRKIYLWSSGCVFPIHFLVRPAAGKGLYFWSTQFPQSSIIAKLNFCNTELLQYLITDFCITQFPQCSIITILYFFHIKIPQYLISRSAQLPQYLNFAVLDFRSTQFPKYPTSRALNFQSTQLLQ